MTYKTQELLTVIGLILLACAIAVMAGVAIHAGATP